MIGNLEHSSSSWSWFSGYICCLCDCSPRHLFVGFLSFFRFLESGTWDRLSEMLLLCYAVGRNNRKLKGWDIPSGFLDWTRFLQRGKEGKNEWMNDREHWKTQTQQARCCSQAFGNTDVSGTSLMQLSQTAAERVDLKQLRTCTAGILAGIKTPDFWKMTWHRRRFIPVTSWRGL